MEIFEPFFASIQNEFDKAAEERADMKKIQNQHSATLAEHSEILAEHTNRLASIENKQNSLQSLVDNHDENISRLKRKVA